jgi:hypothetical protein
MADTKEAIALLAHDTEFLCARVRELESSISDGIEEATRAYYGHVIPALARAEDALAQVSA